MWVQAVAAIKRERELGEVIIPVQAWFRMRRQWLYFQQLQEKKWVFLRLGYVLKGRARVTKARNKHVDTVMQTWGPDEVERRRIENLEIERRRQIREHQLAEEKAMTSVRELQKHFKNWQGKVRMVGLPLFFYPFVTVFHSLSLFSLFLFLFILLRPPF